LQRENEILIFLIVVVIFKCRKSSSYLHTFSTIYLYSKLANALLFFRVKPIYGLFYCVVVITLYILVDEPLPPDSEKIRFFNGEELKVCFFNIFYPQKTCGCSQGTFADILFGQSQSPQNCCLKEYFQIFFKISNL